MYELPQQGKMKFSTDYFLSHSKFRLGYNPSDPSLFPCMHSEVFCSRERRKKKENPRQTNDIPSPFHLKRQIGKSFPLESWYPSALGSFVNVRLYRSAAAQQDRCDTRIIRLFWRDWTSI